MKNLRITIYWTIGMIVNWLGTIALVIADKITDYDFGLESWATAIACIISSAIAYHYAVKDDNLLDR